MAKKPPAPSEELVSIALVRHLLDLTARLGQPTAPILAAAGVTPEQLSDDDGWLPVSKGGEMMHAVLRLSGDRQFYLKMSQLSYFSGFGIVGYLLESSPTLKDAIQSLMRYERLLSTVAFSHLDHRPGEVHWIVENSTSDAEIVRQRHRRMQAIVLPFVLLLRLLGTKWSGQSKGTKAKESAHIELDSARVGHRQSLPVSSPLPLG